MKLAEWLQETRQMRFEDVLSRWQSHRLTQEEAAQPLGVCDRNFRRYVKRSEKRGTAMLSGWTALYSRLK